VEDYEYYSSEYYSDSEAPVARPKKAIATAVPKKSGGDKAPKAAKGPANGRAAAVGKRAGRATATAVATQHLNGPPRGGGNYDNTSDEEDTTFDPNAPGSDEDCGYSDSGGFASDDEYGDPDSYSDEMHGSKLGGQSK